MLPFVLSRVDFVLELSSQVLSLCCSCFANGQVHQNSTQPVYLGAAGSLKMQASTLSCLLYKYAHRELYKKGF